MVSSIRNWREQEQSRAHWDRSWLGQIWWPIRGSLESELQINSDNSDKSSEFVRKKCTVGFNIWKLKILTLGSGMLQALENTSTKKLLGNILSQYSLIVGSVFVNLLTCCNLFAASKSILGVLSRSFVFTCRAVKNFSSFLLAEVIRQYSAFLFQPVQ